MDLPSIAVKVDRALRAVEKPITVAVMGCEVNGPGEAREADVGLACGQKGGLIFLKGEVVRKVAEGEIVEALLTEVRHLLDADQIP